MTTTNIQTRQPSKMDYASPTQFRFKCSKLPEVEFFCQTANIPGIALGTADFKTPLRDIPIPGEKVTYQDLAISFIVDENLNNYKEMPGRFTVCIKNSTCGSFAILNLN